MVGIGNDRASAGDKRQRLGKRTAVIAQAGHVFGDRDSLTVGLAGVVVENHVMFGHYNTVKQRRHAAGARGKFIAGVAPFTGADQVTKCTDPCVFATDGKTLERTDPPCDMGRGRVINAGLAGKPTKDFAAAIDANIVRFTRIAQIADGGIVPIKIVIWAAREVTDIARVAKVSK